MDPRIPLCRDGIPTSDAFRPAILQVMKDGEVRHRRWILKAAQDILDIPQELREEAILSGEKKCDHRVGWALSSLAKAGVLEKPHRGYYQITDVASVLMKPKFQFSITESKLSGLPKWDSYQQQLAERKRAKLEEKELVSYDEHLSISEADPVETIRGLVAQIDDEVATELLDRLRESEADFFERAVIELVQKMGYGQSIEDTRHLGKSGDGGIDGIVSMDPLALRNVYIQAKRYGEGNAVGADSIRNFYGALAERHADNGVFITTSRFTASAFDYANRMGEKIVLIDGQKLTSLMLKYRVGTQAKEVFETLEIDEDFFE
ncbi:MAG: restriction endonuclease [Actinomycetaceae bacterium]|nr:restriction endonuclease [Actinomycetaceae bacterium]